MKRAPKPGDAEVTPWMLEERDRIAALTPEEQDAELRALGFDPAVERAKGEALIEKLRGAGLRDRAEEAEGMSPEEIDREKARILSLTPADREGELVAALKSRRGTSDS